MANLILPAPRDNQGQQNLYILKEVFVPLLKCELAYSTQAFSQEILIDFEEIAHTKTEDVTK